MQTINDDTYYELHKFIGPQLTSIANELADDQLTTTDDSGELLPGPRYLFFNECNLQHSGTIHLNNKLPKQSHLPTDIMNIITDLYANSDGLNSSEDTVVKTLNDFWIVRRTSNWRHFFVVINKNSTLLEITEEAKLLFDKYANNVFFQK